MTANQNVEDDKELAEMMEAASDIHDFFELMGGAVAEKSKRLRKKYQEILSRLGYGGSRYYGRFLSPLDAVLVFLYLQDEPQTKSAIINELPKAGFVGRGDGPKASIRDSIDHQTKRGKNGKGNLHEDRDGIISLTESGRKEAEGLIELHGRPES